MTKEQQDANVRAICNKARAELKKSLADKPLEHCIHAVNRLAEVELWMLSKYDIIFTDDDINQTCLLKDGKPAMIIDIPGHTPPFDVVAQVPGEAEARYITQDKFERVNGVIVQVRD